jgi:O-antigen/teichoic acid export membrane protein
VPVPIPVSDGRPSSVLRSSLGVGAAKITAAVGTLVAAPVLLSQLSSEVFGIWVIAAALLSYANLADLGVGPGIVLEVTRARRDDDWPRIGLLLRFGIKAYLALGAMLLGIMALGGQRLSGWLGVPEELKPFAVTLLLAFAAAWTLQRLSHTGGALLDAEGRFGRSQTVPAFLAAGLWPLAAALVWTTGEASALAVAAVVPAGLTLILVGGPVLLRHLRPAEASDGGKVGIRDLARYSGTVQLAAVADVVNYSADRLIAAAIVSLAAVVPLDLGARLATIVTVLAVAPLGVTFPWLATMSPRRRIVEARRVGVIMTSAAALIATNLIAVVPALIPLWLGREDGEVAWIAVVLIVGFAVHAASGPYTTAMKAEGNFGPAMRFAVTAATLNLAITVPAALAFGLRGVVFATTTSLVIATVYFLGWTVRRRGWGSDPIRFLFIAIGVAALAAVSGRAATTLVQMNLLAIIVGGSTATVVLVLLLGPFAWQHWIRSTNPVASGK